MQVRQSVLLYSILSKGVALLLIHSARLDDTAPFFLEFQKTKIGKRFFTRHDFWLERYLPLPTVPNCVSTSNYACKSGFYLSCGTLDSKTGLTPYRPLGLMSLAG